MALKTQLIARKDDEAKIKAVVFTTKAQQFYHQFREDQIKIIDRGHRDRFDMMYKHLLQPIHDKLNAEFCSHHHTSSAAGSDEKNTRLSRKVAELNKALTKQHDVELTHEEANAIQARKEIDEDHPDAHVAGTPKQAAAADARFMEVMMKADDSGKHIKNREVSGVDFGKNGITEINSEQEKLETVLEDF